MRARSRRALGGRGEIMAERSIDYPTGSESGMSFICNRWVFTGPEGYRVQFVGGEGDACWGVFHYNAARTRRSYGEPMTEDGAHEYAARLSGRTVNVAQEV
jgi:hypothetical protein